MTISPSRRTSPSTRSGWSPLQQISRRGPSNSENKRNLVGAGRIGKLHEGEARARRRPLLLAKERRPASFTRCPAWCGNSVRVHHASAREAGTIAVERVGGEIEAEHARTPAAAAPAPGGHRPRAFSAWAGVSTPSPAPNRLSCVARFLLRMGCTVAQAPGRSPLIRSLAIVVEPIERARLDHGLQQAAVEDARCRPGRSDRRYRSKRAVRLALRRQHIDPPARRPL